MAHGNFFAKFSEKGFREVGGRKQQANNDSFHQIL